jgi:hypothetical protein
VISFPELPLEPWRGTRDTLHAYAQVLGAIRAALAPRQKHWLHTPLSVAAAGLTTTPMHVAGRAVEILLSPSEHRCHVVSNRGERREIALDGQSVGEFAQALIAALAALGVSATFDAKFLSDHSARDYDKNAAQKYWQVLPLIDAALKQLKGEHRGESGPVALWPHGFDLALLLFSGRRVPGKDPADEESADEQMNFGFVTGDAGIPEPYFYATAYPAPAGYANSPLPEGAHWHTQGWTGAVLPYATLCQGDAVAKLLGFFRAARDAGFARMR